MRICICGGGNLGHVMTAFLGSKPQVEVSLLTTAPERWAHSVRVSDCYGRVYEATPRCISASPEQAVADADVVLLCLPGFAIHDVLARIVPWLPKKAWVGTVVSSTGFFFEALEMLPPQQVLFGFQRVPFISRVIEYGRSAELKGYKESQRIAVEHTDDKEQVVDFWRQMLGTPVTLLGSYYDVSLSNSNPLLHPSRLYSLWKDWRPGVVYDNAPLFYEDWTDLASATLIDMDNELQTLLTRLPVTPGSIIPILEYYESHDAASLTAKIRSIEAFKGIPSPMISVNGGFVPDFDNRYFTEDIPYGMRFIITTAHQVGLSLPVTSMVYEWARQCMTMA